VTGPGEFAVKDIPERLDNANSLNTCQVHRSRLTQDKSMFESMFSLASDQDSASGGAPTPPEGDSDENPIRLQGDTTSEFKSLLWALYALCVSRVHQNTMQYLIAIFLLL
jgi:hypothetical protein